MKIILGNPQIDGGWIEIEHDTGIVTRHPGNRIEYDAVRHSANILKNAAEIGDPEIQKAIISAAGEYLNGAVSKIVDSRGNIIAIF